MFRRTTSTAIAMGVRGPNAAGAGVQGRGCRRVLPRWPNMLTPDLDATSPGAINLHSHNLSTPCGQTSRTRTGSSTMRSRQSAAALPWLIGVSVAASLFCLALAQCFGLSITSGG